MKIPHLYPIQKGGGGLLFSETGSFIWTKWHCSKSVSSYGRRMKGFQQIIGMFCFCMALTSCCESFRMTQWISKALNYTDITSGIIDRGSESVCMSLLTSACLHVPLWVFLGVSCFLRPNGSSFLLQESFWFKMSLL